MNNGLLLLVLNRAVGHVRSAGGDNVGLGHLDDGSDLAISSGRDNGDGITGNGGRISRNGDRGSVGRDSASGTSREARDVSGDGYSLATAGAGAVLANRVGGDGEQGRREGRSQAKSGNVLNLNIQANSSTNVQTVGLLGQRARGSVAEQTDVLDQVGPDGSLNADANIGNNVKNGEDLVNLEVEFSSKLDTEAEISAQLSATDTNGNGESDDGETRATSKLVDRIVDLGCRSSTHKAASRILPLRISVSRWASSTSST